MRKLPLALALLMLLVAMGFIGSLLLPRQESGTERVLRSRTIRIGYAWEPPYAFRTPAGEVSDEAPEVAREVLGHMGIRKLEWVQSDFATLIPELLAGRFDMVAAGMFITPERARQVDFSSPSACIEPALLVRQGNPFKLHSMDDLVAHKSARLGVLTGAVEASAATKAGIPPERIFLFATVDLAVQGLNSGLIDALPLSGPSVEYLARSHSRLERARPFTGKTSAASCSGFAFRPEDSALRQSFEKGLRAFIGSPEHLERIAPFGFTPANLPVAAPLRE